MRLYPGPLPTRILNTLSPVFLFSNRLHAIQVLDIISKLACPGKGSSRPPNQDSVFYKDFCWVVWRVGYNPKTLVRDVMRVAY
jgi:hypothetical protein